jgi:hypothetical protein
MNSLRVGAMTISFLTNSNQSQSQLSLLKISKARRGALCLGRAQLEEQIAAQQTTNHQRGQETDGQAKDEKIGEEDGAVAGAAEEAEA